MSEVGERRPARGVKRGLDIVGSAALLVLTAPLQLATAAIVAVGLGRPVLFTQPRPGRGGDVFSMRKFRTMRAPRHPGEPDAARLTRLGRALRATSLDELPSLWNVFVGDLSFVGPRPLLVEYLPLYSARQARRHEVRPGITGLAQVSGRNALGWEERLELDVRYVDTWSLALDARILARTVVAVLRRTGIEAPGEATMPRFTGTTGSGDAQPPGTDAAARLRDERRDGVADPGEVVVGQC